MFDRPSSAATTIDTWVRNCVGWVRGTDLPAINPGSSGRLTALLEAVSSRAGCVGITLERAVRHGQGGFVRLFRLGCMTMRDTSRNFAVGCVALSITAVVLVAWRGLNIQRQIGVLRPFAAERLIADVNPLPFWRRLVHGLNTGLSFRTLTILNAQVAERNDVLRIRQRFRETVYDTFDYEEGILNAFHLSFADEVRERVDAGFVSQDVADQFMTHKPRYLGIFLEAFYQLPDVSKFTRSQLQSKLGRHFMETPDAVLTAPERLLMVSVLRRMVDGRLHFMRTHLNM